MKKILTYILTAALLAGLLAGCGSEEGGTVNVRVEGFDSSIVAETGVEITEPFSLAEEGYVDVEPEEYTALHALVTVLTDSGLDFMVSGGYLASIDADIDASAHGSWAGWMYSYNGELPEVPLSEIPAGDGDTVIVYYCAFYDEGLYHAYFQDAALEAEVGEEITLTLRAANLGDFDDGDYGVYGPLSGAAVLVDGADPGHTTDDEGQVTLTFDEAGTYTVSAYLGGGDGENLLTYAPCVVTVS